MTAAPDTTAAIIREFIAKDKNVKLIDLSRNFGHQIAISAGMDSASGDAISYYRRRSAGPARGYPSNDRKMERRLRGSLREKD